MLVATDEHRRLRKMELEAQDRQDEAEREAKRKNRGFSQVYPKGWRRLQSLIQQNPAAARVYAFLAEHIDGTAGAVVVEQKVMAAALGVHEVTIRRQTKFLEQQGALVRIKVGTGVYAYALDPEEVWKTWDDQKDNAAFITKTLVRKSDKENNEVRRKLKVMLEG
ncbi:helix-turn-helix domain-containing protein [Aminobacter sp. J41]|uniref:helix-turn-helix domain-containing protein n=1 Tax=Aminobacter sp. J41 TaxID=935261 RepID=UPI000466CA75|nr:helix-turn-helix domain-containing protein [Aminobacter sp. J41]